MFLADLICGYLRTVYLRGGIQEVSSFSGLVNKNDMTQKGLIIQLNYHMLENLVRGLLLRDNKKCSYQAFKLYKTLNQLGVKDIIFNDELEN